MIIKIGNKEYVGQCNALSYIFHNRLFKKNIIEELIKLREYLLKINKEELVEENTVNIYNILLRVIYTLIYTHNSNIYDFNNFKEEVRNEIISLETIDQVINILIVNFIDEDVSRKLDKISSNNTEKTVFPEHDFLLTCINLKLTIQDLKILTYIDVIKMLVLTLDIVKEDKEYRKATQADIDKLLM